MDLSEIENRIKILHEIEQNRNSKVSLYVTGDRSGLETRIGQDVIDLFVDHLDALGPVEKISLILYTVGGSTSAAWNLVNLLRMFCDDFEVIAPGKCMSAGTLISLGANRIVMTKQATLGPIDPSLQHPLGPSIPGAAPDSRANVSVEAVYGYLDEIRTRVKNKDFVGEALLDLADRVHPLVLGEIFRSRQQIRDLASRLLVEHQCEQDKISAIIDFLCSESGSHDYTINRREGLKLGLNIEKCSTQLYEILRNLRTSYSNQMELQSPFDFNTYAVAGQTVNYSFTRAIIESPKFGAHHFKTEGELVSESILQSVDNLPQMPQTAIRDQRKFEGWRRVK